MDLWSFIPKRLETFQQYKVESLHACPPPLPCTGVLHSRIVYESSDNRYGQMSSDSSVSWPSGCPEKYSWIYGPVSPPQPDLTLQDLDNGFIDKPPTCPHVAHIQSITRRYRDRIEGLEEDLHRQAHNMNNVEAVNEDLAERVSGLAAYICTVVNDLDATRAIAAANAASARKYKKGMGVVTCLLIICVLHIILKLAS